ncbi:MAG: OsmC family protein [Planctomycetota bacterium]|jgi:ribosomal protein S12 methylthiotransferase accessory factor
MDLEMRFPGGKKVEARMKDHVVLTDQTPKDGGEGAAPAPFDLFVASIGTCSAYYVLSFCQTRNIPLEGLRVTLSTEKDPKKKLLSRIELRIHLPSTFPEKYRDAVVKAAKFCAVSKHLYDPPVIEVKAE